jgi:hypothetical protein
MNTSEPPEPSQREGEAPWHHERTDRSFRRHGKWFFSTREGLEVGPYQSQAAAELGASMLATMLRGISDSEITAQFIREFMLLKK